MMIPDILWMPVAAEIDQKSLLFFLHHKKNSYQHLNATRCRIYFWLSEFWAFGEYVKASRALIGCWSGPNRVQRHTLALLVKEQKKKKKAQQQKKKKKKTEQVAVSAGSEQFTFALPDSMKHSPLTERKLLI